MFVTTGNYAIHGPIDNYRAANGGNLRRGYVSHGCVRMAAADVLEVYARIKGVASVPVHVQREPERTAVYPAMGLGGSNRTWIGLQNRDGAWRWAVLSSGLPESDQTARGSGITLLGFEALGTGLALGARTITAPEDPNAIAEGAQVAARGREALLVYPRVEQDGTLSWMAARAQCAVARGGAR